MNTELLPGFRGDLGFLHGEEGHKGYPYWPGGASGVTVDPGLDLGHANWSLVESVIKPRITAEQWAALVKVKGITGQSARRALKTSIVLSDRRIKWISRAISEELLPHVAAPYWRKILKRFPLLSNGPDASHTAFLSLAYNRGPNNKALGVLREPMARGAWNEVARLIAGMQQDRSNGIPARRRREARLIDPSISL